MADNKPNLNIVPPQSDQPSPPRHQVLVGTLDGWPHIELVDNQTGQRIAYDVPTALAVAANMTVAASGVLEKLRGNDVRAQKPAAPRPTILGIDGVPV